MLCDWAVRMPTDGHRRDRSPWVTEGSPGDAGWVTREGRRERAGEGRSVVASRPIPGLPVVTRGYPWRSGRFEYAQRVGDGAGCCEDSPHTD